ncbi:oxidoreductase [Pyrenochaeta sp. DS3sAY3a]|nr:oxidoreductase [Pyrenochaeta sp. DS3sAY3a]
MASLEGKVIAITGGASGIGLATAKILAGRGAVLSLADLQHDALNRALQSLPGDKHMVTTVDVRDSTQVQAWIDKTVEQLGRLDGAANLAGVTTDGLPIAEETDENWDFLMNVNAKGVFNCIRAEMRRISDGGSIVNAASVAGSVGGAHWSIYAASKHAVLGLTRSSAREGGPRGIRVNAISPGTIDTPMTQGMEQRLGIKVPTSSQAIDRKAKPQEVGNVIAFLLSDESTFVTGANYNVDGGHLC